MHIIARLVAALSVTVALAQGAVDTRDFGEFSAPSVAPGGVDASTAAADLAAEEELLQARSRVENKPSPLELLSVGEELENGKMSKAAWSAIWAKRSAAESASDDASAQAALAVPAETKEDTLNPAKNPLVLTAIDPGVPRVVLSPYEAAKRAMAMRPNNPPTVDNLIPLLRYFNVKTGDTMETVDPRENHNKKEWVFKGIVCFVYQSQEHNAVPFYRYLNKETNDHFFAIDSASSLPNTAQQGVAGYIHSSLDLGLVPFREFYSAALKDHLYATDDKDSIDANGASYTFKSIIGYVHPLVARDLDPKEIKDAVKGTWTGEMKDAYKASAPADAAATTPPKDPTFGGKVGTVSPSGVWTPPAGDHGVATADGHPAFNDAPESRPVSAAESTVGEDKPAPKVFNPATNSFEEPKFKTKFSTLTGKNEPEYPLKVWNPEANDYTVAPPKQTFDEATQAWVPAAPKQIWDAATKEWKADPALKFDQTTQRWESTIPAQTAAAKATAGSAASSTGSVAASSAPAGEAAAAETPSQGGVESEVGTSANPAEAGAGGAMAADAATPEEIAAAKKAANPLANHEVDGAAGITASDAPVDKASATNHGHIDHTDVPVNAPVPRSEHPNDSRLVPLYRYWSKALQDHYYTTDFHALGNGKEGWEYQGIQAYIFPSDVTAGTENPVPIYRYWNVRLGDHKLTTNFDEMKSGANGYRFKGILGYAFSKQEAGTVPLYEYYNADAGDSFYTDNFNYLAHGSNGWKYVKVACYVYPHPGTSHTAATAQAALSKDGQVKVPLKVPLYRYWNSRLRDHLYTTLFREVETGSHGWEFQGVQGMCYATQATGTVPFHRYWNIQSLDHFYTTDKTVLGAGGKDGWVYEGVQCYVAPFRSQGTVPFFGYYSESYKDHFMSTKQLGNSTFGWTFHGIQAYIWPSPLEKCANPPPNQKVHFALPAKPVSDPLSNTVTAKAAPASLNPPVTAAPVKIDAVDAGKVTGAVNDPLASGTTVAGTDTTSPLQVRSQSPGATRQSLLSTASSMDTLSNVDDPMTSTLTSSSPALAMLDLSDSETDTETDVPAVSTNLLTPHVAHIGAKFSTDPSSVPDLAVKSPMAAAKNKAAATFLAPAVNDKKFQPKINVEDQKNLVPLYRYWNGNAKARDHFLTTKTFSSPSWQLQGVLGYIYKHHVANSVPLFRYFNAKTYDHYYSVKYAKNGEAGFKYQGIVGFVRVKKEDNMVPMLQYNNAEIGDHHYSTQWKDLGQGRSGWVFEGVACYIFPPQDQAAVAAAPDNWTGGLTPVPLYSYQSGSGSSFNTFYSTSGGWGKIYDAQGKLDVAAMNAAAAKSGHKHSMELTGIVGLVYLTQAPSTQPLHRYRNKRIDDTFYTTNWMTLQNGGKHGWVYEGVQCYVYTSHANETVPVYRYYDAARHNHEYTTKYTGSTSRLGGKIQGISFYVKEFNGGITTEPGWLKGVRRQPLYRYFNAKTNDHLMTVDATLLGKGRNGWKYQGIAAYVPVDASTGTQAIYSYYNEVSKDHFLTTNFNSLGSGGKYGWSYHGVEALTFKAQYTGTVPLLRYYSKSVRDHVYLTDPTVLGTEKAKADGWAFQGVEGYVFPAKDE